jgi:hypothetical protein
VRCDALCHFLIQALGGGDESNLLVGFGPQLCQTAFARARTA